SWKAWVALVVSPLPLVGYIWWASAQLDGVGGYFGTQDKHWNSGFDAGVATLKWVFQTLTSTENAGYLLTTLVIIGVTFALVVAWLLRARGHLPLPCQPMSSCPMGSCIHAHGYCCRRPSYLSPGHMLHCGIFLGGRRGRALAAGHYLAPGCPPICWRSFPGLS